MSVDEEHNLSQMSSVENDHSESTYQVQKGTVSTGTEYERIFISTIILDLLLDDDVQDFQLSSNDKDFLPFDDVVIEIKRNEKIGEKLAIQLKHEDRQLSTKNLTGKDGEFSISNNFARTKACKQLENFEMILFTIRKYNKISKTFTLEDENIEIKMRSFNSTLLSDYYRGKGVSYKFESSDKKISEDYDRFLKHFILCCNQLNADQLEVKLQQKFQQAFECEKSVFMEYLNFITKWTKRKGTRKKLNKSWIKDVIVVHLLSPYVQPISSEIQDNNEKNDIFRRSINNFDITVFEEKDSENIAKLWSIKRGFEKVDIPTINQLKTKYQINSSYIKNLNDLNQKQSSMVLWLLDKCPLIIKYNKCITKAVQFMTKKKIVILYDGHVDGDFSKSFCNLKIFRNLMDLKENFFLYEELVTTFHCSLQGKEKISLETLIGGNHNFENQITTSDLLLFLNDDFMIGEKEIIPDIYIERFFSRHIIDNRFLSELNKNSVIIISNFNTNNRYLQQFHVIDIEILLKQDLKKDEEYEDGKIIYICRNDCSYEKFETICSKLSGKSKYHHFSIFNNELEWICSRGGIEDLKQFQSEENLTEEKELFVRNNNVVIICGDPGLGKTTSMKYLKNCTYPSFWTMLIYPKDHSKYFREKQQNVNNFEQYIFEAMKQTIQGFGFKVFQNLFKSGRVNFIWDGLDEISRASLNEVLNVIKEFSEKGLKQCMTSRNNLRNELENRFSAIATTIRQFNEKEQKYYVTKRLQCLNEERENIFPRIQSRINFVKDNDILSIPLQIYMFTELFIHDQKKYSLLLTNTFSLTDLYYHFILQKFNIYFKEKENLPENNDAVLQRNEKFRNDRMESYQEVAVQMYFSEETVNFINYDKCDKFLAEIRKDKDSVGIITGISSDNLPNFIHNSYGEYFAAYYLSKNYRNIPNLSQFLFEEKYKNIRFLFDLILAENSPAHIAVLCKNFEALKKCDKDSLAANDLGGRNPLQLACSYGVRYPLLKVTEKGLPQERRYIVYEDKNRIKKPNLEHQNILRHLLDICSLENTDQVYKLNSLSYADETLSLSSLAILSEKHIVPFRKLKNFNNIPVILYYSAAFNFSAIFKNLKTIPQVYTQKDDSLLNVAATNGSVGSCKQLMLKHKVDVNSINQYEESPLFVASKNGHLEIVELLVKNGAQVNVAHIFGYTPLYVASENGHLEIVELLVKNGALVNFPPKFGCRSLCVASENGHLEIVELLVKNGALVNFPPKYCCRSLYVASENGHLKIVELLVKHGAQVDAADKDSWTEGKTPLYVACQNGHVEIVELLVKNGAQVNAADIFGHTPLYVAFRNGHLEIVELLVKNGAQVNAANKYDCTALYKASQDGHVKIAELLVKNGAQVNAASRHGKTPLHVASKNGHMEIVELLVKNGALVNATDKDDWTRGMTPLHAASENGYVEIVELLVKNGALVNTADKFGRTPLYAASENGHMKIVDLLVKNGALVNAAHKDGWTPLYGASRFGHLEIVELLVKNGALVNTAHKDGWSPLYVASQNGHLKIFELLVKNGALVNAAHKDGWTPLYVASKNGHLKIVDLLVKNGALVNAAHKDGWTPLYGASRFGHLEIVELLVKNGALVNATDKDDWTPLCGACENGHLEIVELLVKNGAQQVNAADKDGWTPLHMASQNGHLEIVELLINNGAQVNAALKNGWTPLYIASGNGHLETVDLLVKNEAQVNAADNDGWTPLYKASENGHMKIVELLLKNGTQVTAADKDGRTILHVASASGHLKIVELLVKNGALVNAANKYDWTPLYVASKNGHLEIVELLVKNEAQVNVAHKHGCTPLYAAAANGHLEIVELLVKNGALVNAADKNSWTPLHMASQNGQVEIVELLVKNGAQVNTADEVGWTPLHRASLRGHVETVDLLVKNGAQVNVAHKYDWTPLYVASKNGHLKLVEFLVKNGAQVNAADYEGWTPLHIASKNGHMEIVELLVKNGAQVNGAHKYNGTPLYSSCNVL